MSSKIQSLLLVHPCSSMLMPWTWGPILRDLLVEFSCCLLWLTVLDPWHKNCKPCSYNSGSAHMQCLLSLRKFLQVRLVQMTAEPCQGSNKCNPLTTWCLATKCGNHPRTAPDLNLRLQRAFRGWLLQVEAYNSGSWLHTFVVQTIQLGDKMICMKTMFATETCVCYVLIVLSWKNSNGGNVRAQGIVR